MTTELKPYLVVAEDPEFFAIEFLDESEPFKVLKADLDIETEIKIRSLAFNADRKEVRN